MERNVSIRDMLIAIISVTPQLKNCYQDNEEYKPLITFLTDKDYYNQDNIHYPTFKVIENATGLKTHKLRKQIKDIYEGLLGYEDAYSMDFETIEIYLYASFLQKSISVKCKNLKHIPRVGEEIDFMFLKAELGTSRFYVTNVIHSFENDQQIITIWLKGGFYNSYYRFRLDEALAKGEINSRELYELHSFEINERLGLRKYL